MDQNNKNGEKRLLRVGITHGDTNGIGYELIFKTFANPLMAELFIPVVYGSAKLATYHRKAIESEVNFQIVASPSEAEPNRVNLINCFDEEVKVDFGKPSAEAGKAAFSALSRAVEDCKNGKLDVLVTAPVNKANVQSVESSFVGHTEYLQKQVGGEPLMILFNQLMRVALVTTHLPISKVAEAITEERVLEKARTFYHSLRHDFLLSAPRLAVLSLNPHCGDDGLLGTEEKEVICPAIEKLKEEEIPVYGPYSADGFFAQGLYKNFDGILAMYHDQGLVPFKALSDNDGVNFTAGLEIIRTSPDHGTAYDIAGKGVADENSFRQAIFAAIDIYHQRHFDKESNVNPLPKLYHDRREEGDRQRHFTLPFETE